MVSVLQIKNKKYIFLRFSQIILEYSDDLLRLMRNVEHKSKEIEELRNNVELKEIFDLYRYEKKLEVMFQNMNNEYIYNDKVKLTGAQINVANGCNLKCKYCFADGGTHGKSNIMSLEMAIDVVNYIHLNYKENHKMNLCIIGGEPLFNQKTFKTIAEYSKKTFSDSEVELTTTTNGTLLDDEIKHLFKSYNVGYMISLDSHEKSVNDFLRPSKDNKSTYDKIFNNYLRDKNEYKDIFVHITVTPYNKNISDIAKNLLDLGIKNMLFSEVKSDKKEFLFTQNDVVILKEEYDKLTDIIIDRINGGEEVVCFPLMNNLKKLEKRQPVKYRCGALSNSLAFDPNGDIYPCDMLMWDKYRIGNIDEGIDEKRLLELKRLLLDEDSCKVCWARYLCGGECLSDKTWENKEQRYFRCEIRRHIYKLRIYLYEYIIKNHANYNFESYKFTQE